MLSPCGQILVPLPDEEARLAILEELLPCRDVLHKKPKKGGNAQGTSTASTEARHGRANGHSAHEGSSAAGADVSGSVGGAKPPRDAEDGASTSSGSSSLALDSQNGIHEDPLVSPRVYPEEGYLYGGAQGAPGEMEMPYERMVAATDGYSGSDMRLVCKEAAMQPLRRLLKSLEAGEVDPTHGEDSSLRTEHTVARLGEID